MSAKPDNMTDTEYLEMLGKALFASDPQGTLAPSLVGMAIDLILCGVMAHQAVLWAHNWKQERKLNLYITIWVIITGFASTCAAIWYCWDELVKNFGTYGHLLRVDKSGVLVLITAVTAAPCQVFYLERAYRLLKQPIWLPVLVVPLVLASLAGGISLFIMGLTSDWQHTGDLTWGLYLWLGSTMGADVLLTAMMVFALSKNKTGWSKTDQLVKRLIRMSAETQTPGALVALAFLITFAANKASRLLVMWEMFGGKVYIVCLLAVLNYRYTLRQATDSNTAHTSAQKDNTFALHSRQQQRTMMNLDDIRVDTVVHEASYELAEDKKGVNRSRMPDEESGHSDTETPDEFSSTVVLTSRGREH